MYDNIYNEDIVTLDFHNIRLQSSMLIISTDIPPHSLLQGAPHRHGNLINHGQGSNVITDTLRASYTHLRLTTGDIRCFTAMRHTLPSSMCVCRVMIPVHFTS